MPLDSVHFEVLYLFSLGESKKLDRDIISACGGKEDAKVVLQELERTGLIEQVHYGEFELSERGKGIVRSNSDRDDGGPDRKLDSF